MWLRRLATFALVVPVLASPLRADARGDLVRDYIRRYTAGEIAAGRSFHALVPSFSRQTGLACSACHYQFPALTPFGRQFKLNGYTLTTAPVIREQDQASADRLQLSSVPLVAAMVQTSLTHTAAAQPGTQNDNAELPQQASLFLAGAISSRVGIFSQMTYSGADNVFGIDNTELRYAKSGITAGGTQFTYGLTLNNNPTMQDLWNTTAAWGFPFTGPDVAPGGAAGTLIDGALGQQVVGLGAYTMLGGTVYGEFSVYRSAMQGRALPDSFAISGVAPYWRLALQKQWGDKSLMVGTFGLTAKQYPGAVTGGTDRFTDVGIDAQAEGKVGTGHLVVRGAWVHESQKASATFADGGVANLRNTLRTLRLNTSYYPSLVWGLSAGYFSTSGTRDALLYAPAPVFGSASGSPRTNGFVGELDFNAWENVRLGLQYTLYRNFNGGRTDYDGSGRNASDNNTLYLLGWLVF